MVDVLLPSLHAAFELHGAGPLLTVLSAMSRAHAIKIESTRHGVFVKCHFVTHRRCADGSASTRASSEESVLPHVASDVASDLTPTTAEQFVLSDVESASPANHALYREELLQFRYADGCDSGETPPGLLPCVGSGSSVSFGQSAENEPAEGSQKEQCELDKVSLQSPCPVVNMHADNARIGNSIAAAHSELGFETVDSFLADESLCDHAGSIDSVAGSSHRLPVFCQITPSSTPSESTCQVSESVGDLATQVATVFRLAAAKADLDGNPVSEATDVSEYDLLPDFFDADSFVFCPAAINGGGKIHSVMRHGRDEFVQYVHCHVSGHVISAQVVASLDRCLLAAMNVSGGTWMGARGPFTITAVDDFMVPNVVKVSCDLIPEILVRFSSVSDAKMFTSIVRFSLEHRAWLAKNVAAELFAGSNATVVPCDGPSARGVDASSSIAGIDAQSLPELGPAHALSDPNAVNKVASKRSRKKKR